MSRWHFFLRNRDQRDATLDSEIRFHIDALTEENIEAGMSPAEARRQAQLEFGGREQIKEDIRDIYRVQILDAAKTNLRAAFRFLRKSPSFSIAVILTLALGIGANSAVFSAIDAILLKPLPFPQGDQLVKIGQSNRNTKTPQTFVAPVRLEDWNRMNGTKRGLSGSLAQSSRTQVSGRNRLQWLLVAVQVALAVTLLAGAGLLLRSFEALGRVSPGFEFAHVLTLHISASWGETGDMKGLSQRIDRILDTLHAAPGVENAATAATLPGVPGQYTTDMKLQEGEQDPNRKIVAESRFVSHAYFDTMKIPTLAGENCRENYDALQVMVNRSFADTYLQGQTGIGKHIEVLGNSFLKTGEIKGVVADARELGLNRAPAPTVYWCWNAPMPDPNYLVRSNSDNPMLLAQTLRQKIREIEPGRSVFDITPLSDHLDDAFAENRMRTVLLAFFAATAISLACVGLYGTLSYSLTLRRREVGLRLALGAARGEILKRFLLEGAGVAALGCIAGCLLALAFARTLSGMLYSVTPYDPLTLAIVVALVLAVAFVASLIPAVRASHVEPMQVLREE